MPDSDCSQAPTFTLAEAAMQAARKTGGDFASKGFLALGQTVFWDEPMKAGLAIEAEKAGVPFLAGIHDTDYFAKLSGSKQLKGQFATLAHNDGSTRSLWSAAAEFSTLFGSETVVTKEQLLKAGLRFQRVARVRPGFLDEATEAWGWRGIVALGDHAPMTMQVSADFAVKELCHALRWAVAETTKVVPHSASVAKSERLTSILCDAAEKSTGDLASIYRAILPEMYSFAASQAVKLSTTQTSELLRLNSTTCSLPRFDLLRLFLDPATRARAVDAYNQAVHRFPGLYELDRFGSGALPFDVVIPEIGRGTLRLGNRGAVLMTPVPQFLSFKKPVRTLEEFTAVLEAKFGPNCAVIGKAVTLIGMLGREFNFVFHQGASGYVVASKRLHELLGHRVHPILRICYKTWDSLEKVSTWLELPEPFRAAFGTKELCSPSFAGRWRSVIQSNAALLDQLGKLRKPMDLIRYLEQHAGGAWATQAAEYKRLHARLAELQTTLNAIKTERKARYDRLREIRTEWQLLEAKMGNHFRLVIRDKVPTPDALEFRKQLVERIESLRAERAHLRESLSQLGAKERALAQSDDVLSAHNRRREIEIESELKRLSLIREAVISGRGLENANRRPSAWWLPVVSPDGSWFRETMRTAECFWEPLI